ncbi:MAG TPA: hypothetical protein VHJ83_15675 [Micromonosporaceae bacterium]|jgi:hypothetical protein|nr:hypothetical protein [Micromonosporaceae bacterium]
MDPTVLASAVVDLLVKLWDSTLSSTAARAAEALLGLVGGQLRRSSQSSLLNDFEDNNADERLRGRLVSAIADRIDNDPRFRDRLSQLLTDAVQDTDIPRSIRASEQGAVVSGVGHRVVTGNRKVSFGGLVVAFVALGVIALILLVGRPVLNFIGDSIVGREMTASTSCREFLQQPRNVQDAAIARISDELGTREAMTPLGRPNIDYLCSQDQDLTLGEAIRMTG